MNASANEKLPPADQSSQANAVPTSIWSPTHPGLQVIWDSTSLRMLMECPRKYQLHQIEGWTSTGTSMDLLFGSVVGDAIEHYYKAIIEEGMTQDAARLHAVRRLLELMWDPDRRESRTGVLMDMWRCTGTTKFRNAKGNAAKCPYSHKGKLFPTERPHTCSCGSATEAVRIWNPYHPTKDTRTALRMLIWYTDDQYTSNLLPMSMPAPNGREMAMFEVPWNIPIGMYGGHQMSAAGWFDSIKAWGPSSAQAKVSEPTMGEQHEGWYVCDFKTTKHTMSPSYWAQYWPNAQVALYDAVASTFNMGTPYLGVAIEAFQILKGGVRTGVRTFTITPEQRAEFLRDMSVYLSLAVAYHSANHYPQNSTACKLCEFKIVCASPPAYRPAVLRSAFTRSRWNPLTRTKEPMPCDTSEPSSPQQSLPSEPVSSTPSEPKPGEAPFSTPSVKPSPEPPSCSASSSSGPSPQNSEP